MLFRSRGDFAIQRIGRFEKRHDELWNDVRRDYPCAVRDASYLQWKYVEQPGQAFECFDVRESGRLIACFVLKHHEPAEPYLYRRAVLVDLLVAASQPRQVRATLDAAYGEASRRKADALLFHVINPRLAAQARAMGFLPREATRVFLVAAEGAAPEVADAVQRPDDWLITLGDSDEIGRAHV